MLGLEGRSSAGLHLDGFLAQGGGRGWSFYREVLGRKGVVCRGGIEARSPCGWFFGSGGGRGGSFYRESLGCRCVIVMVDRCDLAHQVAFAALCVVAFLEDDE